MMATKTNYDKFIEIEGMMDDAEVLMKPYIETLSERYEYMKELRREFSNLSHTIGRIQQSLEQHKETLEVDEDVKVVVRDAISNIDGHIEAIESDGEYDRGNVYLDQLKDAKEQLEENINADSINGVYRVLKVMRISVEEVEVLMEYVDAMKDSDPEGKRSIISRINRVREEYISSFVAYREAIEQDEDVKQEIEYIIAELEDEGFTKEADELTDVKPDISEERGKRPDPSPLLELLTPIKSAGLDYFQSNNRKSESYDLNKEFSDKIAYARRALLEDREYIGTVNAFNGLLTAFNNLSEYMYARFYQLGGIPENYHGHDDRKK